MGNGDGALSLEYIVHAVWKVIAAEIQAAEKEEAKNIFACMAIPKEHIEKNSWKDEQKRSGKPSKLRFNSYFFQLEAHGAEVINRRCKIISNLKSFFEQEISGCFQKPSSSAQRNVAFSFTKQKQSTNKVLEPIEDVDIEEMDIIWQNSNDCYSKRRSIRKQKESSKEEERFSLSTSRTGKQEKNERVFLTMEDGVCQLGEHTELKRQINALNGYTAQAMRVIKEAQKLVAYKQAVKKLEAFNLILSQKQQLSLNEKLAFQANEIHEKDEKLKRYMKELKESLKEKEQCYRKHHLIKDCDYYEKKMAREAEVKRVVNTGTSTGNKNNLRILKNFNGDLDTGIGVSKGATSRDLVVIPNLFSISQIRDCYEKKLISVEKIHTDLKVADLLTKPFDGPRFNYLVVSIGQEHATVAQSQPSSSTASKPGNGSQTNQAAHGKCHSEVSQEGEEVGRVFEKEDFGFVQTLKRRKPEHKGRKNQDDPLASLVQGLVLLLQQKYDEPTKNSEKEENRWQRKGCANKHCKEDPEGFNEDRNKMICQRRTALEKTYSNPLSMVDHVQINCMVFNSPYLFSEELASPQVYMVLEVKLAIEKIVAAKIKEITLEVVARSRQLENSIYNIAQKVNPGMKSLVQEVHDQEFDQKSLYSLRITETSITFNKEAFQDNNGKTGEDAVEHIEIFLKIVDLLNVPNMNHDQLRIIVFPFSLTRAASKFRKDESIGSITTWVDLMEIFFGKFYPPSRTGRKIENNGANIIVEWDPTNIKFEN
ncbi:hypothetical protein Tco_1402073 [Tanacetum coccineum]